MSTYHACALTRLTPNNLTVTIDMEQGRPEVAGRALGRAPLHGRG